MGLFDSISDVFSSAVSDIFGGGASSSGSYLGGLDTGLSSIYSVGNFPTVPEYPTVPAYPQPTMSTVPMIGGMMRHWAMRFPALWTAVQSLSQRYGTKVTVERLWAMLRSSGPQFLVGLIGAAALNELFIYHATHKRRRMNVANTKALRRSVRRLKGFDRLSHRVSAQLSRVGGSRRRASSRRCSTCRKSPCAC